MRIASTPSEEVETHLRSLKNCIWLIGVERCVSHTNDLVQRVVTISPGVKPVILAAYQMADDILAALKAGACGFLCQDIPGERLIKSLELIALGETVVVDGQYRLTVGSKVRIDPPKAGAPAPATSPKKSG